MAATTETANTTDLPPAYTALPAEHEVDLSTPDVVILSPDGCKKSEITTETSFDDDLTRLAFTQKVIAIKFLQLLICMLCLLFVELNQWWIMYSMRYNLVNYIVVSSLFFFGNLGLLYFCTEAREQTPFKHLFLLASPITFAFFIVTVMPFGMIDGIFIAVIFLCIVLGLLLFYTVFSIQTELKFTQRRGHLITGTAFVVTILISAFVLYHVNILFPLFPLLIASGLVAYWLYDINAMVTNYYHSVITPADFIQAALNLQIDYVFVFKRLKTRFVTDTNRNIEN